MGCMRFEQFDPVADEARRETCRQIFEASREAEDPAGTPMTPGRFRFEVAAQRDSDQREMWLAADDSGPAGYYLMGLPGEENLSLAGCSLWVAPGRRRHGAGTALLAHCAGRARAAGRTRLHSSAMAGSPGEAFARAAGASPGIEEVRRDMPSGDGTAGLLTRLRAEAEAVACPEYAVVSWAGPTPEADLGQVAGLYSAMSDAPRDDGVEPGRWDGALVRRVEEQLLALGAQLYQVAARHRATGTLAAMSIVIFDPEVPRTANQGNTVVARAHRGRRLGLLVKTALYEWLTQTRPDLREFRTWNADANRYMGAINEQLGFRVTGRFRSWEVPVATVLGPAG